MASGMPSFAVVNCYGIHAEYTAGREGWSTIKCESKRAYGCGKSGKSAVKDLDLLLFNGDLENLSSSLSVRAGEKVFSWVQEVVAAKGGSCFQEDPCFRFKVDIVDKGLIVVTLCFAEHGGLEYYLVFDIVDRSLSLIPYVPDWATYYTPCPLPLRRDDGSYSLVLFGSEFRRVGDNHFIWQWSPSQAGSSSDLWQTKELRFPAEIQDKFFSPDVLFSFNGMAFWTDLALGTLCCDCSAVLAPGCPVNFTFIELPPGYQIDRDVDNWPVGIYRTMGCVGGSIKFVSIDKHDGRGTRVKVWTLAPSSGKWKLYSELRLKSLWKDFKASGLPKDFPMWPMLREQEEGATLYFILAENIQTGDQVKKYYICRLDLPSKSLLKSQLLTHSSFVQRPVILPSGFFEYLDPLPSRPEPILMEG